jgi:integrase
MKIEKLKNETYRIRQQYKGKKYTVYFDHKPTQKEALQAMAAQMDKTQTTKALHGSVRDYIQKYVDEAETDGLSPSTIRGYDSICRNLSSDFAELLFNDVTSDDVQKAVDSYSKDHSAKSTRNFYGVIRSAFTKYRPQLVLTVKMPAKEPKTEYEPTTKDIQNIIEYSEGTNYHVALQLAVLGLRCGETCALTIDDLNDDNVLTINKDLVKDKNGKYVLKNSAKTQASNRRILLPSELADEIRRQGYVWKGHPNTILKFLNRAQDDLGIPRFRLHMLRHFCVAYLHKEGMTSEQIMAWGGWETDHVMNRAYRYNLDPHESKKDIAAKLGALL